MAPNDEKPSAGAPSSGAAPPSDRGGQPVYETFPGSKPEDGNGTPSAAPAPPPGNKRPTISEAAQTIKMDDWTKIHTIPCAREGFMTGIAAGFLVGGGRYVAGSKLFQALNWGVGGFVLSSLVGWEYCQAQRRKEKMAIARVVEVMDRKAAEKKQKIEEAARRRKEAEEKAKANARRWYKFW